MAHNHKPAHPNGIAERDHRILQLVGECDKLKNELALSKMNGDDLRCLLLSAENQAAQLRIDRDLTNAMFGKEQAHVAALALELARLDNVCWRCRQNDNRKTC